MMRGRIKVACINWTSPDAPHAVGYILEDGIARNHMYFPSHADAMAWADRLTQLLAVGADRVPGVVYHRRSVR